MELQLQPSVLRWARERAGLERHALADKLKTPEETVAGWERDGRIRFTLARKLAHVTHTPEGYLFLLEPPEDKLPIPDFRTLRDQPLKRPSPDLLETVQTMQQRQAWMRDYLVEEGHDPLPFVGSARVGMSPATVAKSMRQTLGLTNGWARQEKSWSDALVLLRHKVEAAGVLIVFNGVVGNNNSRKLDPDEFRGFALCDAHAPLVFINGSDFKSAQMFTLAHELAHVWAGKDGVSNFDALQQAPSPEVEIWCNSVAAELLIPEVEMHAYWSEAVNQEEPFQFIARAFKVSSIVAARRALDLGLIDRPGFLHFYQAYAGDERRKSESKAGGGSFWNNQNVRVGSRFGTAVVSAARDGRLLFRDAYRLTGLHGQTFTKFAEHLGFAMR